MHDERQPIFNVPTPVLIVAFLLIGIHVARLFLSPEADNELVVALAFVPARFDGLEADIPGGALATWTSFVTHMLVHGDAMHLAFNVAWLLAFGGAIAPRTGPLRFFAFLLLTGIAGAATFYVINPHLAAPVIGASGAVSGLMGATMRVLFSAIDRGGFRQLQEAPGTIPLMSLKDAIADRRIQLATLMFVLVNLLAIFGLAGIEGGGSIAWEAHLGGYFAGFLTYGWFDDPGFALRQPTEDG